VTNDGSNTNEGWKYNFSSNQWKKISDVNAPSARSNHTAIWTSTEMIIWGGDPVSTANEVFRYNLATDSWASISNLTNAPTARHSHSAIWTGTEMIIWGGKSGSNALMNGGRYNPIADSWNLNISEVTTDGSTFRYGHSAIWTGNEMIIWGGYKPGYGFLDDFFIYNPISNSWELGYKTNNKPSRRAFHTANWINNKMLIWGGNPELTSIDCTGRFLKKSSPTHGSINSVFRYDFIKQ
jgi:N-acetylneuraminic acid mutarotase